MSYDYHGSWDSKCGHNSPLYADEDSSEDDKRLTVDWTLRLYLTLGVPLEKLILGIPFYGRSFTLRNKKEKSFGSKTIGDGIPGEATRERGFLSYGFEICKYIQREKWTRNWSKSQRVPFAYKSNQWVGYDDEDSIRIKVLKMFISSNQFTTPNWNWIDLGWLHYWALPWRCHDLVNRFGWL